MPELNVIKAMEKTLHPEIEFVGYEDKGDVLLWTFNYTYSPFSCKLALRVIIKTDREGQILNVAGV